jgi:2-keto-3-deoxy-L-rhamnonate aldolase RhmA
VTTSRSGQQLAERLRGGEQLVATFSSLDSPAAAEIVAAAGFEVVLLDLEHGELAVAELADHIRAVEVAGAAAVVRIAAPVEIGRALDAGAAGVLCPDVSSAAEAAEVVAAGRYAPAGTRGAAPMARAARYGLRPFAEHHAWTAPLLGVQIEGEAGLAAVEEIIAVPGLDLIFLGPYDLSQRLGVPGEVTHPVVVTAVRDVVSRARAHGVATGVWAPDAVAARAWLDAGVSLVAASNVPVLLAEAARTLRSGIG